MSKLVTLPPPVVPVPVDQVIVVDELVTEGYRDIPLHLVRISHTNRTRFNPEALQQLADNIAEVGILQPILMRPVTPTADAPQILEIVAGERRFRAAVMACLQRAPASIKLLTDKQAAEIQLLENIQRENPHPLEEAIGFEQLMLKHGYNADQLAAKIKQSRSYVYARLKLCALSLRARGMFLDDIQRFPASTALLIARIPTPDLQDKALGEIMAPQYNGDLMSVRQAAQHIAGRYTLNLEDAPFDIKDAKLLAAAGNCTKCPKRTGNQPEIYADTKNADVCTDPDCFAEKKAAHHQRILVIANKRGVPVLEGDERQEVHSHTWSRDGEFVVPNTSLYSFERVNPETKMSGSIRSRLNADELPQPVKYLKESNGEVTPVYRRSDIQAAFEAKGVCESPQAREERQAAEATDPDKAAALEKQKENLKRQERERLEREHQAETKTLQRVTLYRKVRGKAAAGLTLPMLRELAKLIVRDWAIERSLPDDLMPDLYPCERDDDAVCDYIDQADSTTVQLLIMDLLLGEGLGVSPHELEDDDEDHPPSYSALKAIAVCENLEVSAADLAVASIDIDALQNPTDVREAIADNVEHLAAVCAHIIDKAPYHLANVEAAANSLGYFYSDAGWQMKDPPAVEQPAVNNTDAPVATGQAVESACDSQPRTKLSLKAKTPAPETAQAGPVIKVKKNRAAQAQAAAPMAPAAAWPFPTQRNDATA
jgi:ParB/RepB/Spo0J family partition protein